jgi:lipid A disaccharide synthetase
MNKPVVEELIQDDLTPENIKSSLDKIIEPGPQREAMKNEFKDLYHLLKAGGAASKKAAEIIHQIL